MSHWFSCSVAAFRLPRWHAVAWVVAASFVIGSHVLAGDQAWANTRYVEHCPHLSELSSGTRSEAIHRARLGLPSSFQLRVARRVSELARRDRYRAACAPAVSRLTWFVDLHPPGQACAACDSHLYLVRFRHGGWHELSWFSY